MTTVPPLDLIASRAVIQARLFERAVHDSGPWTVGIANHVLEEADRVLLDDSVQLTAVFPAICWLAGGPVEAVLYCRGEPVDWQQVLPVEEQEFRVTWELGLPAGVPA